MQVYWLLLATIVRIIYKYMNVSLSNQTKSFIPLPLSRSCFLNTIAFISIVVWCLCRHRAIGKHTSKRHITLSFIHSLFPFFFFFCPFCFLCFQLLSVPNTLYFTTITHVCTSIEYRNAIYIAECRQFVKYLPTQRCFA